MPDLALVAIEQQLLKLKARESFGAAACVICSTHMANAQEALALADQLLAALHARDATLHRLRGVLAAADEAEERPPAASPSAGAVWMVRPDWNEFAGKVAGYIACSCGSILQSFEATREHWQRGHFDYVVKKTP